MTKITKDGYVQYVIHILHSALVHTYNKEQKNELTKDLIDDPVGIVEQLFIQYEHPELM